MDCVVLVPRRLEPWRDRLWGYVHKRVEAEIDWPIHEGVDDAPEPMNRAAARNRAAQEAGDWDVAVFLDADTVPDFDNLREAVELAGENRALVCAQTEFRSLTRESTRVVLAGSTEPLDAAVRWVYLNPKSSCIAVGREMWEAVGGFDERFQGWGYEDSSFFHACQALGGIERLDGECHHLWHPRSPEKAAARAEYQANQALGARYKTARHTARNMHDLLAEPGGPLSLAGISQIDLSNLTQNSAA